MLGSLQQSPLSSFFLFTVCTSCGSLQWTLAHLSELAQTSVNCIKSEALSCPQSKHVNAFTLDILVNDRLLVN